MKKMLVSMLLLLAVAVEAKTDVYDVKMSCRVPVISGNVKTYKTKSFQGYSCLEYDAAGNVLSPCRVVLYGDLDGDGSKETFDGSLDIGTLNRVGKNGKTATCSGVLSAGSFNLSCCGEGTCYTESIQTSACSVQKTSRVDYLTCYVSGTCEDCYTEKCGTPCSYTYPMNCYTDCPDMGEAVVESCTGTLKMKFSRRLTEKVSLSGFDSILK